MANHLLGFMAGSGLTWVVMSLRRDGYWREFNARRRSSSPTLPTDAVPMERLDSQALAVQLEEDGKYLLASARANECPKTRDLAVRVIRAAFLLAGGWGGKQ
jgi:hypothetical protein